MVNKTWERRSVNVFSTVSLSPCFNSHVNTQFARTQGSRERERGVVVVVGGGG